MEMIKTSIEGLVILEPNVFEDDRGYFLESYKESIIRKFFPKIKFVQDNESKSSFGVLRGLHFQSPPFEQTKLVRVISGKVLDIAVDLRKKSKTFGLWESILLSDNNKRQFFIPKGFAHGFVVLSQDAIFSYKVDNYYQPHFDTGIIYNDKDLGINWQVEQKDIKVSSKDENLQTFEKYNLTK